MRSRKKTLFSKVSKILAEFNEVFNFEKFLIYVLFFVFTFLSELLLTRFPVSLFYTFYFLVKVDSEKSSCFDEIVRVMIPSL